MSVVDDVKSRVNIVDVVGRYTQLRRAGTIHKGICPFHSERTPSFVVYESSGTWHCFGSCGTGGDVFSFLMKKEGLTFREALERLAQEVGVSLDEDRPDPGRSQRDQIYKVNEAAAAYFRQVLLSDPRAQAGRDYLARRQVDARTAEAFGLGYSLEQWSGLRDHLLKQGYSVEIQLAAGLIKRSQERESTYDAFRNRVIFPIRDRQGRVLGFGGRVLDDSVPKYLNTGDTPVFHKSQIIYGIDLAHQAIRGENRVVIVEGYMDVIAAHQFGYQNVVACMGTALTADHLRQLQRLTHNYVLALDADAAGNAATMRGLHQARLSLERRSMPTVMPGGRLEMTDRLGASISIVQVPNGKDPDDFIRSAPDRWPVLIAEGQPLVDYYFGLVVSTFDLKSAAGRAAAVEELALLIGELEDEIQQDYYIKQLSSRVQVSENILYGQVRAASRRAREEGQRAKGLLQRKQGSIAGRPPLHSSTSPSPAGAEQPAQPPWDAGADGFDPGEPPDPGPWDNEVVAPASGSGFAAGIRPTSGRTAGGVATSAGQHYDVADHILALLLRAPDLLPWISQKTEDLNIAPPSDEDMERTEDKELFRALRLFLTSDEPWNLESFQESLDPPLFDRLTALALFGNDLPQRNDQELREGVIKDIVNLRLQRVKMECETVKALIAEAQRNGDHGLARELGSVFGRLQRELEHLQPLKHREFHKPRGARRPTGVRL